MRSFKSLSFIVYRISVIAILLITYHLLASLNPSGSLITVYAQAPVPSPQAAAGVRQLQDMVQRVINVSVGLAFFFMSAYLVWSGFKFITSGGEAKALQDAWRVFTWAILGILFLALAWLALLLIENFTGAKVTVFCFGFPGTESWLNGCK